MVPVTLIPTSRSIVTANNKSLHIMGAVLVEIRAEKECKKRYTKQFCYLFKEVTGVSQPVRTWMGCCHAGGEVVSSSNCACQRVTEFNAIQARKWGNAHRIDVCC